LKGEKMNRKNRKNANADGISAGGQEVAVYPPAQTFEPTVIDDVGWLILLEPAFQDRPQLAETLARYLFELKEAVERGPEGIRQAVESLGEGIRQAYLYTNIHRAALQLFCLHLAGEVVGDDPQELLDAAIKRSLRRMERQGSEPPAFLEATGDRAVK
jgi:hypothetical protein